MSKPARDTDGLIAYRTLRRAILRNELTPGEALVESELSSRFGVSHTPLRDALHLLAHDGLVEILPRRGTFVSQVTLSDLHQIFEARVGLEQLLGHWAAVQADNDHRESMRSLATRASAGMSEDSDVELDAEFHDLILNIVDNRFVREMYQRLADASLRLLYLTRCDMESRVEQVATLTAAADALERKDGDELSRILIEHVRGFRDRVGQSIFNTFAIPARL